MNAVVERPWAKLARDDERGVAAALPLADHGFDVAAVFATLLREGGWTRSLTQAAGRDLTEQDRARLTALVALHDIGKANAGFQARSDRGAAPVGHEGQVAALLLDRKLADLPVGAALHQILRQWGAAPYVSPLMAHHGRPRIEFARQESGTPPWAQHVRHWQPASGYDPAAAAARLVDEVRARWPLAWEPGERLPQDARFVALFAGLLVLADWLGSDTTLFPVAGPHGAMREALRARAAADSVAFRALAPIPTPVSGFEEAFAFAPRGVQLEAAAQDLGPVALIEAETGSGKTEAALWRWLALRRAGHVDGLFFALPTRSAAVQLHGRVNGMLKRVWGGQGPQAMLAVPGYLRAGDAQGHALPGWKVRWDDDARSGEGDDSRWAAERSNRFLAARVAVGTIDQALLGALRVRHAPFRAAALARSLLVVDEVHASDAYMGRLLEQLIDNHVGVGGHVLLLSATLGAAARARLLTRQRPPSLQEALAAPYPAMAGSQAAVRRARLDGLPDKCVTVETTDRINDPSAIATKAVAAARTGASVLVVRNTVSGAVDVAQAVEAMAPDLAFRVEGVSTLHHGRFAPDDRRMLDASVSAEFGKARSCKGRILVGTQTLEQSLDIDADLLLTDLAPMDVLLQRIGRLHRHPRNDRGAFSAARVVVLRPAERDLTSLLGTTRDRHGLGPMKNGGGVYPDLLQLEATLRLLESNPTISIPADNRRLVEGALHPEVLDALAKTMGTVWSNHAAARAGSVEAERRAAAHLSLDLSTAFRDLHFPPVSEDVATRLGVSDLLIDLDHPPIGPFGQRVGRITIPSWMAGNVTASDPIEQIGQDEEGWSFRLGTRRFVYGRWGLLAAT